MIDYEQGTESDGIPQMIAKLKQRPYVWGKHFAPHDIKSTDLGTGKTRLETARALGWHFVEVPDIGVDNGISAGKLLFPSSWFDEVKCQQFLDAIGQYRQEWDEKKGMFRDVPLHDWTSHPADMWRYAAVVVEQMVNEKAGPVLTMKAAQPPRGGPMPWGAV
jgi:hypothetical protein